MKKRNKQPGFCTIILFATLLSCNASNSRQTNAIKFTKFNITFNSPLSFVSEDSSGYRGLFLPYNWKDTVYFNLGYGDISSLFETLPEVIYTAYDTNSIKANIDSSLIDTTKLIIYTNKISLDQDELRRQNVYFEKIAGYKAKITLPIQIEKGGMTGVYFDSLRKDSGGRLKFNLYANNLDSVHSGQLVQAIRTIRFHLK